MALNRLRIDGHNRYEISTKHNIPFGVTNKSLDSDEGKGILQKLNLTKEEYESLKNATVERVYGT